MLSAASGASKLGKLRVAVLLPDRAQFSVYFGGALVRWTYEVYRHLLSTVDVTTFGFPTDPETKYPLPHETSRWSTTCIRVSKIPVLRRFESEIWLRSLLKRLVTFDVVHIHNRPQWVGALRRIGYRGCIILHLQNDHLGHWTPAMLDVLAKQLDGVAVCSTYIGDRFCPKSRAIAAKTRLIFNGVNTQLFFPRESAREPKTVFFVGSFIPQKGVLQLVQAFDRVLDTHPDAKLVIGGSKTFGINQDTPYIRQVNDRASAIRSQKNADIHFAGSIHHDKELPSYFQRATIFSSPSLFQEPFGLVNAEAMACATPVVGSSRGGIPQVLNNTGVLVDPENTEEYAAALNTLLDNPAECRRLGIAGYERSRKMFDWPIIADCWLTFLMDVVARKAA
jgi:spore coat protein SA